MALGKPFINTFKPFDATTQKIISFIYNGDDFTKRQYKIAYQNGDWLNGTEQTSTFTQNTKEYSITLYKNTCHNGMGFIIYVRVGNTNNEWSEWSNGAYFWCYSDSILSFNDSLLTTSERQPVLYIENNMYEFKGQYSRPQHSDEWFSCQYVLKQYDAISGVDKIISDSGLMFRGNYNTFPSYIHTNFSKNNGVLYKITLFCTTNHGVVLQCEKNFIVNYTQLSMYGDAKIRNLKDKNDEYTGKIELEVFASRLRADNIDNINTFNFIQDNNTSNFFLDLTNDSRKVTFTQGFELIGANWNLLIHIKNFKSLDKKPIISPITNMPISYQIEKNQFLKIIYKDNDIIVGTLICYYNNIIKRFIIEYDSNNTIATYISNKIEHQLNTIDNNTIYTDLFSILIKKTNASFDISANKI